MSPSIFLWLSLLFLQLFSSTMEMLYVFSDFGEHLLVKNNLIATFDSWEKRYYVIFKIKPLSNSYYWDNVIHVSLGNDMTSYGDRNPAVWFRNDGSGIMRIHSSANGTLYGYIDTPPVLPDIWSTIQICQDIHDGIFFFSVYINGKFFQSFANTKPEAFKNVRLYASDPWYNAKDGLIKDLKVITGNENMIAVLKEHALVSNNLIATLPLLEKTFSVSFKVKPNSFLLNDYSSVIHLTIGNDFTQYGDRIPGVWFSSDGSGALSIFSSINGYIGSSFLTKPLQLSLWSSIRISQFQTDNIYMYAVYLNGENIYIIENKQPQAFINVNVYAANPWYQAQDGFIKDVRIVNGNEETCGLLTLLSASIQNEEVQIHVNLTTNCVCYLQNVTFYLLVDPILILKGFLWDNSILNETFVKMKGKMVIVDVDKLYKDSSALFSAIFVYGKFPNGRTNASIEAHSKWNYCYGDPIFKVNQININVPIIQRFITAVVEMNPIWSYNQPNQTILHSEKYQFVCTNMQKRQPSPCYQREITTGIITFFPIHLIDIFGYDNSTGVVYGRTHRNNVIEINLYDRKPLIITKEICSKMKACHPFFSEN
ncbi:uncharacterized protein LOC136089498 [Hydra vulgaris]|uniref:Uncharacterized protein LOC136089498 n=1 Tax=Hydra vulgaris TaxID=6087 RepID=A0ABM4DB49_HYDVU